MEKRTQQFVDNLPSPIIYLLLILFSSSLTLLFWWVLPATIKNQDFTDYSNTYYPVAQSLIHGQGLRKDNVLVFSYPPGYSLIIAGAIAIGNWFRLSEGTALLILFIISADLKVILSYHIADSIWNRSGALLAALLVMTYLPGLWMSVFPLSEGVFTPVLLGAFALTWYAIQNKSRALHVYWAAGAVTGLAMLIRPILIGGGMLFAGLVAALNHSSNKQRLLLAGMVLLGNLFVIAPWEIWVYQQTGRLIPLSQGGVKSMADGLTFAVAKTELRDEITLSPDVIDLQEDFYAVHLNLRSFSGMAGYLWEEFKKRPITVIHLFLIKAGRAWYGTDSLHYDRIVLLFQLPYLVLITGGGIRCWRHGGDTRRLVVLAGVLVLYFWIMTILVLSILRYTTPVISLALLLIPALLMKKFEKAQAADGSIKQ